MKAAEAEQSYGFRETAFKAMQGKIIWFLSAWGLSMLFGAVVLGFGFWYGFHGTALTQIPHELYYLLVLMIGSSAVLLFAASVALLNFAVRCYGHHNNSNKQEDESPVPWKVIIDLVKSTKDPTP